MFYLMFPSRTPYCFSGVVSKLAKFCSAYPRVLVALLRTEKKKKITESFLKNGKHPVSFDGGCQRSSQGRDGSCLSVSALRGSED